MSVRTSLLALAIGSALAATFAPATVLASERNPVHADGWQERGDSLVFVGHSQAGKSRADVRAELAAWRKNPVSHDGWSEIGGDHLVFVGNTDSTKSSAEVRAELAAWNRDPRSHDGYSEVGDSLRFVGHGASTADVRLTAGTAPAGKAVTEASK